jgi:DNA-binding NtrC family response regulator
MNLVQKGSNAISSYHSRRATEGNAGRGSSQLKLKGSRILIVEDEFIIALEVQSCLEEAGATVVGPAFTVSKAIELASRENLSAAVLDLRLGRDSAAPIAAVLAERHIPFVFYTGQPATDPVRRAWPQATTVSKPASDNQIVSALAEIIRTTH